jgi:hypothetical protein
MAGGSLAGINGISHGAADAITHLLKSNVECILPMEIVCGMGYMWGKALNESLRLTAQMYQNQLSLSLLFCAIVSPLNLTICSQSVQRKGLLEKECSQRHTLKMLVHPSSSWDSHSTFIAAPLSAVVVPMHCLDQAEAVFLYLGRSRHRCRRPATGKSFLHWPPPTKGS